MPIKPPIRRLLDALTAAMGRTAWKVVEDALLAFHDNLAPHVRARVDADIAGVDMPVSEPTSMEVPARYQPAVRAFLRLLDKPHSHIEHLTRDYIVKFLRIEIEESHKQGNGQE